MTPSKNFSFLNEHSPLLAQLGHSAEQAFSSDPNTTLIKLRQMGEAMAQDLAARFGIVFDAETTQSDLLYKLQREIQLDQEIRNLFHTLRIEGNKANHQFHTKHKDAMDGLKVARALAIWFHQSVSKNGADFKAGPFVPPQDPSVELRALQTQIEKLKAELGSTAQALENNKQFSELVAKEKEQYSVLAMQMDAEARSFEALALEHEAELGRVRAEFDAQLKAMQQTLKAKDTQLTDQQANAQQAQKAQQTQQLKTRIKQASSQFSPNEELTRILIDQKLNEAGWEANTQSLTYAGGARPEAGKNKAISEWPTTGKQSADYLLFAGLIPIAAVEAKRVNVNVAGKIQQAQRYSRGFQLKGDHKPAWQVSGLSGPWADGEGEVFNVPFVYSCNGRPYLKQLAEQSGTWFRDVRSPANTARALSDFHRPDGLLDLLSRSKADAQLKLQQEGFAYLHLREYQQKAIQAVETALEDNRRQCLLAMATGTGKTRTIVGLMYRFLKAERFRRILFLVDRTALGDQATGVFHEALLEQNMPLSKLYNIAELGDMAAQAETRVQVATVQAMVSRIFQSDNPPGVDEFDCIIVDEAHRGYTLDQEMTEGEMAVRDQDQYMSSYRRTLDYFDAVKIGLTATPAKHTTDIFGKPVYTYSYREAVADDWLIDHEPPIRYETLLNQNGIKFDKGEVVSTINQATGEIETAALEDELQFDVESFNKRVITEGFNKVICQQLAQEINPMGDEKTLIFCATDLHADMVKRLLDEAFLDVYGNDYTEAAVQKITGASDNVALKIQRFKNEHYPSIAITVDLLTTGIDVPRICHLVFMRRVRSRILYEQMIGRATRRCDEIGKTVFKIYDPVDIYAALQDVSTMKPLVKDPNVTLEQLVEELNNPVSHEAVGTLMGETHAHDVLAAISQKVMRVLRKAAKQAETKTAVKEKLEQLEQHWGIAPNKLPQHLHQLGPKGAADFIHHHSQLLRHIAEVKQLIGSEYMPVISHHPDELMQRVQSYGDYSKPEDYLQSFSAFIQQQINQSAAISVVVNRPKDLTRQQLKEVRLLLDQHHFNEATLQSAWREKTNLDIAASIVGHIRQAALGEALLPFDQRVANAMQRIYALTNWTQMQRNWLARLAKQLVHEVVIDTQFANQAFSSDGGAKKLNERLGGQLDLVLVNLADALWQQAA
ncbi:MAG: type I restriction-modification system endonuclease [Undibacterium umbellatum]|uniref:type I restriction-modification system endonuclease n=1 Tax=Undibacterium umbellatum TaxID=2762300 RepID=UPI003BB6D967